MPPVASLPDDEPDPREVPSAEGTGAPPARGRPPDDGEAGLADPTSADEAGRGDGRGDDGTGLAGVLVPEAPTAGLRWSFEWDLAEVLAAIGAEMQGDPGDEEAARAEQTALDDPGTVSRDLTAVVAESLPTGPGLAAWLAQADTRQLTDWDLPGIAGACRRLVAWAQARELAAVAAMVSRAAARDEKVGVDADGRPARVSPGAAAEVSLALTMSQVGASWWAGLAVALGWRLTDTGAALAAGIIDVARARLIAEATNCLDDETARAVEGMVLPGAGGQTTGQLRAALRRAVIKVDPRGADERRREAERHARVTLYPDEDGTAALIGSKLPGVLAAAAMARISAMARARKAAGAGGPIDLLRAQTFIGLLLGTLPLIPPSASAPPDEPPPDEPPPDDIIPGGPGGGRPGEPPPYGPRPGDSAPSDDGGTGEDGPDTSGGVPPLGGSHGSGRPPDGGGSGRPGASGHPDGLGDPPRPTRSSSRAGPPEPSGPDDHGGPPAPSGDSGDPPYSGGRSGSDDPAGAGDPSGPGLRHGAGAAASPPGHRPGEPPLGDQPEDLPPPTDADAPPPDDPRGDSWMPRPSDWDDELDEGLLAQTPAPAWPPVPATIAQVPQAYGSPPSGRAPPGPVPRDGPRPGSTRRPPPGLLDLTVSWAALTGTASSPPVLGRLGPVTVTQAVPLVAVAAADPQAQWRVILVDHDGYALAVERVRRGRPGRHPGRPAGVVGRVTVTIPITAVTAASRPAIGPSADGQATTTGKAGETGETGETREAGEAGTDGIRAAILRTARRAAARAAQARAADSNAPGGCAHTTASASYRPPTRIRELVEARDQTCRQPTCRQPAWRSDLDHTQPWHKGGLTCICNLGGGCRTHHQVKQLPGWTLRQLRPGYFEWTTPTGRTYITGPDPYPS